MVPVGGTEEGTPPTGSLAPRSAQPWGNLGGWGQSCSQTVATQVTTALEWETQATREPRGGPGGGAQVEHGRVGSRVMEALGTGEHLS